MAHAWSVNDNVVDMVVGPGAQQGTNSLFFAMEVSPVVEEMDGNGNSLQTYDGTSGCYPSTANLLDLAVDANSVVFSLEMASSSILTVRASLHLL